MVHRSNEASGVDAGAQYATATPAASKTSPCLNENLTFSLPGACVELRHLRYFVAVAEDLSFRRAAERLRIAQPGLSQRIKALERDLGVTLFDRGSSGVQLTTAGAALLPTAREVLDRAERVTELARDLAIGRRATLRVGYTRSAGAELPTTLVRDFQRRYPTIEITTTTSFTAGNVQALRGRDLDVGFVRPPLPDADDLAYADISGERVRVALHKGHPLARRRRIHRRDIADEPLVYFPRESAPGLWRSILDQVYGVGVDPRIVRIEPSEEFMLAAVADQVGISLLTEAPATVLRVANTVTRRFSSPEPTVALGIAWRHDHDNPAIAPFVRFVTRGTPAGPDAPRPTWASLRGSGTAE